MADFLDFLRTKTCITRIKGITIFRTSMNHSDLFFFEDENYDHKNIEECTFKKYKKLNMQTFAFLNHVGAEEEIRV